MQRGGKLWDQTAGPEKNPNPECQPRNAECSDLDSQSEGEAADAESTSDETDNSEDGNEVEALDSRLDEDKTHATDGKNDDTDESKSEVASKYSNLRETRYHAFMSMSLHEYEEWLKKNPGI